MHCSIGNGIDEKGDKIMGYESRFYIVRKYNFESMIQGFAASEIVASLDMCKMGYDHHLFDFFTCQAPFVLRIDEYDEDTDCEMMTDVIEDKYGDRIMYCTDINGAIEEVKRMIKIKKINIFKIY